MATRQREKAAARIAQKDNRPTAVAKYVRITPSKVRIILDLIRGKDYKTAEGKSQEISLMRRRFFTFLSTNAKNYAILNLS